MVILFIGDSLIEYFDWQEIFPEHNVINLGISGEMVEELLLRTDEIISDYPHADMIFIMTGINNISLENYGFLKSYKVILKKLIEAYPNSKIYVNSLLPTAIEFVPNDIICKINSSLKELVKETGVEFIDIYSHFIDERGKTVEFYLLEDGVHISNKGYNVWSDVLN